MAREAFDAFELFLVEDAQFVVLILFEDDKLGKLARAVGYELHVVGGAATGSKYWTDIFPSSGNRRRKTVGPPERYVG